MADTSLMPIFVTMDSSHESTEPNAAGGADTPQMDVTMPGSETAVPAEQDGLTPERLKQVIRRLETGYYDSTDVREQIARRAYKELDS